MVRHIFGFLLIAMGLHTVWQALRRGPLVIGYGHSSRRTIANPHWYQRALWFSVGLVFFTGGMLFVILPVYT